MQRTSSDRKLLMVNPQNGELGHRTDVYTCDLEGQNVRAIWEDQEDPDRPGNRVADMAIVRCTLGDTNLQALTLRRGYNYPVAASPDGNRILFHTEDEPGLGRGELWVMNRDGTERRKMMDRKLDAGFGVTACWFRRSHSSPQPK